MRWNPDEQVCTRYVVRDKDHNELNVCETEARAQAYCDYYNESEMMRGCKVWPEKRRPETEGGLS